MKFFFLKCSNVLFSKFSVTSRKFIISKLVFMVIMNLTSFNKFVIFSAIKPTTHILLNIPPLILVYVHHIPYRGTRNLQKECLGYDTKLNLMVRVQFKRSRESGVPFHCHYIQTMISSTSIVYWSNRSV